MTAIDRRSNAIWALGCYLVAHPTARKWVITPVINRISRVIPLIAGVIIHLLSGMSHQVGHPENKSRFLWENHGKSSRNDGENPWKSNKLCLISAAASGNSRYLTAMEAMAYLVRWSIPLGDFPHVRPSEVTGNFRKQVRWCSKTFTGLWTCRVFCISCVSCNLKPLNCPTYSLLYGLNGAQVAAESPDWYSWWFLKNPLVQFIWAVPKMGVPQNGWFIMENPI